jgi:hypothetical protein
VSDFSDTEVYGEPGEDGRPVNIPEKFYTPADGDTEAAIDVGSLLTSHNYFESKIGSAGEMFGSPEDSYAVPEVQGYEFQEGDPLVNWFSGYAKENNLSQKLFEGVTTGFIETQMAIQASAMKAEKEKLGADGEKRIKAYDQLVQNWTKDLPKEQRENLLAGYRDATVSAATIEFLEFLQTLMQPAHLPSGEELDTDLDTLEKLRALQTEAYPEGHQHAGKRRYEMDKAFREDIQRRRKAILGEKTDDQVVGA